MDSKVSAESMPNLLMISDTELRIGTLTPKKRARVTIRVMIGTLKYLLLSHLDLSLIRLPAPLLGSVNENNVFCHLVRIMYSEAVKNNVSE